MSMNIVVERCKEIEFSLEKEGAKGKGLHEKLSSLKSSVDDHIQKKIRYVATIRNKVVHEHGFCANSDVMHSYNQACDEIDQYFKNKQPAACNDKSKSNEGTGTQVILATGLAAYVGYHAYHFLKEVWKATR